MVKVLAPERVWSRRWCFNHVAVIVGASLVAAGFNLFVIPHDVVPGGVVGLAQVINEWTGWPVGLVSLALNLPLLVLATRLMGPRYGVKTTLSMLIIGLGVDALAHWRGTEPVLEDVLVSVVFGGLAIGGGIALVLRGKGNAGGTPLVGQLIARVLRIPVGRAMFYTDTVVIGAALLTWRNPDLVAYALICLFAISRTVDLALNGLEASKAVLVISEKHAEIRDTVLNGLERGGTYLCARGLYEPDEERQVILSALSVRESVALQRQIKDIDPQAFCMVFDTSQVIGEGFRPWR
jgi:uncharacterized membrane-anchored protein YitT (DUF2179 family)